MWRSRPSAGLPLRRCFTPVEGFPPAFLSIEPCAAPGERLVFRGQGVCLAHSSPFSLQSRFHAGWWEEFLWMLKKAKTSLVCFHIAVQAMFDCHEMITVSWLGRGSFWAARREGVELCLITRSGCVCKFSSFRFEQSDCYFSFWKCFPVATHPDCATTYPQS